MSDDAKPAEDEKPAEGAEGEGEESGKKGSSLKKLLIILVPLLLLIGGGAGAYFTGLLDGLLGKKPATEAHADKDAAHGEGEGEDDAGDGTAEDPAAAEEGGDHAAPADEGHATPAAEGGGDHGGGGGGGEHGAAAGGSSSQFVKVADEKGQDLVVNLNSGDGPMRLLQLGVQLELSNPADAPKIKAIMPRVIDQFQTYLRELRVKDLRGSAGIYRLQMELLARVNQAAAPIKVKDVLFEKILIQ